MTNKTAIYLTYTDSSMYACEMSSKQQFRNLGCSNHVSLSSCSCGGIELADEKAEKRPDHTQRTFYVRR